MGLICVAGARPNFMKIKAVMDALEGRGIEVLLVHTGQHYDSEMSDVFFEELGLRRPDRYLGVGSGSHAEQTAGVILAMERVIEETLPAIVVVVGDVNSTMAAAIAAAKAGCLVAHVEAGLRSRDWRMPEEINRVVTDRVSDYLFAPSDDAVANLRAEGYREDQIHLVGNVMIDTLFANLERARARPILEQLGLRPGQFGLVTLHRPDNVDNATVLAPLLEALGRIGAEVPVVFPAHPRTQHQLDGLAVPAGIAVIDPLGYLDFIALEASARVVLTDSGGIQEETTVLGVPCLTLRDTTERPITVSQGTNRVIGRDPERIVAETLAVLKDGVAPRRPALWDGRAGERIAEILVAGASSRGHLRPTDLPRGN